MEDLEIMCECEGLYIYFGYKLWETPEGRIFCDNNEESVSLALV